MNEIKFVDVSNNLQPIEIDVKQDGGPVRWCTPKKPYRFRIRPKVSALRIEHLHFGTSETGHEWHVHDVAIGGVSAFVQPPAYASDKCDEPHSNTLPGDMFSTRAIADFVHYGEIRGDMDVVIDVSYVGDNPEGQPLALIAECAVEHDLHRRQLAHQQLADADAAKRITQNWEQVARVWTHAHVMIGPVGRNVIPLNSGGTKIKPGQIYFIKQKPESAVFTPERLFISAAGQTPLEDWHICDLSIANRSLYKQCGSLSGALFSNDPKPCRARPAGVEGGPLGDEIGVANDFVAFGRRRAFPWQSICLTIAYNGDDPEGREFYGSLMGFGQEVDLVTPGANT